MILLLAQNRLLPVFESIFIIGESEFELFSFGLRFRMTLRWESRFKLQEVLVKQFELLYFVKTPVVLEGYL